MSYIATMPIGSHSLYRPFMGRGMGDAFTDYNIGKSVQSKNVQIGGAVAAASVTAAVGSIASSLTASGAIGILGLTGPMLSAAVPFIGPALMGATLLVQYLIANSGCGQTCIVTSQWANQAAAALQQNLDAYFALPAPRYKTQQALALGNFDVIWKQLQQACGQPGTGDAGKRCITDRQRGACTWKNNGQCWDWFKGYRDGIANDLAQPDPTASSEVSSIFGGGAAVTGTGASSLLPLLLIGGLVALGISL